MGETGDSKPNLGLDGSAKNVISRTKIGVILKRHPGFEIRADNGRFRDLGVSRQPLAV
jgi:hypothetical protein